MLEELIGSKTRVKLIKLFISNPSRKYYVREITRTVDEQINSVRRELAKLLKTGFLLTSKDGNRVYYYLNEEFPFIEPMQAMIDLDRDDTSLDTSGSEPVKVNPDLKGFDAYIKDFNDIGKIELLVLGDAFNSRSSIGVDVVVVGSVNTNALEKLLASVEKDVNQTLKFALFTWDEFKYRQSIKDRFVTKILASKVSVLVDNKGVFK